MAIYWTAPDEILGRYFELAGHLVQVVGLDPDAGRIRLQWDITGAAWVPLEWWEAAVQSGLIRTA